ncbi:hypothetical protein M441DRAFT_407019 [Trichoderma asperellum CBS 433.97]|uniref:Uncharacterized protein n=1 Tax=Trichoderma asperellum (strain ATCC 204424 / CBS 433.97 / NBRC 101777) TaxID=1042311 RepID=A0A2T3Z6S5_TRIA4|nr:hypothetical protein M441DRAFT_407019 [Trichoderma asperellum CBS 433.97]PTB40485.1 hypothetical protein M441DRAFT_407019 [Trichoderma asperellum CBS 433.97]
MTGDSVLKHAALHANNGQQSKHTHTAPKSPCHHRLFIFLAYFWVRGGGHEHQTGPRVGDRIHSMLSCRNHSLGRLAENFTLAVLLCCVGRIARETRPIADGFTLDRSSRLCSVPQCGEKRARRLSRDAMRGAWDFRSPPGWSGRSSCCCSSICNRRVITGL